MQKNRTLSIFLKRLRLNHNDERLVDMASKLNVSQSFLSAIESGKRHLNDKLLYKIVDMYHLSEDDERELMLLRDLASNKINITLDSYEKDQKETVVQFLSNVRDLDKKSLQKINLIIKENKDDSK
jgi:transcriptional regulator with XRE-family HTH domain